MPRPTSERYRNAHSYRKSAAWRAIRAQVIERDGDRCRRCRSAGPGLTVHHLTYARLFAEQLDDLVLLCGHCHSKEHVRTAARPKFQPCTLPEWLRRIEQHDGPASPSRSIGPQADQDRHAVSALKGNDRCR